MSIDEAFLDVAGLRHIDVPPVEIGARLRALVRDEVGLAITVGVARTPFLAKVAGRVAKPDGLLLVEPDGEDAFLHPLPVEQLWGVGAVTAAKLRRYGLVTAGDIAALPDVALRSMLGPAAGRHLFAVVHGMTPERVETGRRRGSIGAQRALGRGPHREGFVRAALLGLVDRVCRRMRGAHRIARTVVLRLRFDDYTRATRSHTFPHATDSGDDLAAAALLLLDGVASLVQERGLTLVGVALTNLASDDVVQPALPSTSAGWPGRARARRARSTAAAGRRTGSTSPSTRSLNASAPGACVGRASCVTVRGSLRRSSRNLPTTTAEPGQS
ncbi:hypothetical protein GCM10025864_11070 [Luteimicrobium album]|uniref:UmuC domain-containing protein n=1 Tax=Luteimicrobium album TaxID=1054550 RepID=A0ABQ6I072_9MICO|nr:DNA polymerase IV [Luteimicrobium album]GMA23348.1 hypothetical protein GCM10025864_11070 [Luteimicrobium album]